MHIKYDPSVDAAFLYLREVQPGEIRRTESFVINAPFGAQEVGFGRR